MRATEPHLAARAVRPLVSGFEAMGRDPRSFLARGGIEPAILDDPDARVPMRAVVAFMTLAGEAIGDSNIGLHLAEHAALESFDVHLYAMLSSPDLGSAYERLCRYQRLIHETTRLELDVHGDRATLRHLMPGGMPVPRHGAEFIVTAWVRAGRVATAVDWAPSEVRFAHAVPPDPDDHARFFRAPVRFAAGENSLVLPAETLALPCARADAALLGILDRYAADRLAAAPHRASMADHVRAAIAAELRGEEPRVRRIAARLKMSVRTLNRALKAEGTSYRELLEQLRHELAVEQLARGQVSSSEIAFLLGFSELSAFHRAFKRWTGITPAEFRRSHRGDPR